MIDFNEESTVEGLYHRFKYGNPQGTVAEFQKWYNRIGEIQSSLATCPWCQKVPELVVIECQDDELGYIILCRGEKCPVQPSMDKMYDSPEGAKLAWETRKEA